MKIVVNNLLEVLNNADQEVMNVVYKALMAYSIGMTEVNEEDNKVLDAAMEKYFEEDGITSFINDTLYDYVEENIENIH